MRKEWAAKLPPLLYGANTANTDPENVKEKERKRESSVREAAAHTEHSVAVCLIKPSNSVDRRRDWVFQLLLLLLLLLLPALFSEYTHRMREYTQTDRQPKRKETAAQFSHHIEYTERFAISFCWSRSRGRRRCLAEARESKAVSKAVSSSSSIISGTPCPIPSFSFERQTVGTASADDAGG